MTNGQVILVDSNNKMIDAIGKMEAHQKSLLHRAISVFIFYLQVDIALNPQNYTVWFKMIVEKVQNYIKQLNIIK